MKLKKMLTPYKINQCEIKNRFVVPAMVTNFCDENGNITDEFFQYHLAKAKGGWGLIITEDFGVNPNGVGYKNCIRLYDKKQVPANKKFTDAIHQYGTKIFAQVFHPGRQTNSSVNGGVQPVAAATIPDPFNREIPHELTRDEIYEIVKEFGNTARLIKASGYDGIELHLAHGYLLAGFLSLRQNRRTDEYGGNLENRLRIIREIYHEMRRNVGQDFPITVRISSVEDTVDGRKFQETLAIIRELDQLGFDGFNISNGEYTSYAPEVISSSFTPRAYNVDRAKKVRDTINKPIIVANGINEPILAENVIEEGAADFVGMARASLADPELPIKASEGRWDEINYCIRCLQGCEGGLLKGGSIRCMVNPMIGHYMKYSGKPLPTPKKVLIIGAGPAGLEAAVAAARRGHNVTLWEASDHVGGEFIPAMYPPAKGEYSNMITFLRKQLEILKVNLVLNKRATVEEIKEFGADKTIIATGAQPNDMKFTGEDTNDVTFANQVLVGKHPVEGNIVIIGGGEVGTETASYLADTERGKITVVEYTDHLGFGLMREYPTRRFFRDQGVTVMTKTNVTAITKDTVEVTTADSQHHSLPADHVILSTGYHSNNDLYKQLTDQKVANVVSVGDAKSARDALAATQEGFDAGFNA